MPLMADKPRFRFLTLIDEAVAKIKERERARQPKPWLSLTARAHQLGRFGIFYKAEIENMSLAGRNRVLYKLERACAREAKMADEEHWSYNHIRHADLFYARNAERLAIDELTPVLKEFEAERSSKNRRAA